MFLTLYVDGKKLGPFYTLIAIYPRNASCIFTLPFLALSFADGQLVKSTFTSHNGWVAGVDWSPTNEYEFVSGAYDSLMKLWDTRR